MDQFHKHHISSAPFPIIYGGYATSGGTVIRHFLDEFEDTINFKPEFRILRERYGLIELYYSIFHQISPENIDIAIRDFTWLAENFARELKRFGKNSGDYDKYSSGNFSTAIHEFINKITDFSYPMDWHFYDFEKSRLRSVAERKMKQFGINLSNDHAYLATPTKEMFFEATQLFIKKNLIGMVTATGTETTRFVGLHNATPSYNSTLANLSNKIIGPCKMVIVDRDPRDIFLSLPTSAHGRYLKPNCNIEEKAKYFVKFYKFLRKDVKSLASVNNVKQIQFESLVLEYDKQIPELIKFLGLEKNLHTKRGQFFNPEISIRGVKKWKNAKKSEIKAISIIERALEDDLYETR
jgi:hypothetical protein